MTATDIAAFRGRHVNATADPSSTQEVIAMRVFVTGASGYIGSAVVPELLSAGHEVVGLARSDASAAALEAAGASVQRGDLHDLDALRTAAAAADGVIHLAFIHDFANFAASLAADRAAIEALVGAREGTDKPLVVTGGVLGLAPGRVGTEQDVAAAGSMAGHRSANVDIALQAGARGVRSSVVRLSPSVHGEHDHGFVAAIVAAARDRGVSGYIGDGANRWAAVHRLDAARLYRLALEQAPAGSVLHGVADEGVPTRDIAAALGEALGVPAQSIAPDAAPEHFGWIAPMFALDGAASSTATQQLLDWTPRAPSLLEDIAAGHYTG